MKNVFLTLSLVVAGFVASAQPAKIADTVARPGLPVLRSYVAPDVIYRAVKKYGRSLYCIEKVAASDCENSYLVGLLRDGKSLQMEFMCDNLRMVLLQHTPAQNESVFVLTLAKKSMTVGTR